MSVIVSVEDTETGDTEVVEVRDNYVIITADGCSITHIQDFPTTGKRSVVLAGIKGTVTAKPPIRPSKVEAAARVAMHWFNPEGEGKYPDDPDLDARGMYELLREALAPT